MENNKRLKPRVADLKPLLDNGYSLLPLHRPFDKRRDRKGKLRVVGKAPIDKRWTAKTYDARKVVKTYGGVHNIGVQLRDTDLILDVDVRHNGKAGLRKLRAACPDWKFENSVRAVTGGGGLHIFLTKPADLKPVTSLPEFPGVEFKTKGTQIVAPGSVHPESKKYYHWDALSAPLADVQPVPKSMLKLIKRPPPPENAPDAGEVEPEQLAAMLEYLKPEDYGTNETWLPIMFACHQATGGDGREEFISWSTSDPAYADRDIEIGARWDSCDPNKEGGITARSLYKELIAAGCPRNLIPGNSPDDDFTDDIDELDMDEDELELLDGPQSYTDEDELPKKFTFKKNAKGKNTSVVEPTRPNLRLALHKMGVELSYDVFARRGVVKGMNKFGPFLGDREADELRFRMEKRFNLKGAEKTYFKTGMMTLAVRNSFHPVHDYLNALQWDGVNRIDRWLVTYAGAQDTEFNRAVGAIVLIAAVRRVRQPGEKFDELLTLESDEGQNKSSALRMLAVKGEWFTDSIPLDADDKHMIEATDGKWIGEIPELQSMRKNDWDKVKSNLSRATDRARMAYGTFADDRPRQFICIGTTNSQEYLFSPYGNRRFWPVKVRKFKLDDLQRDRDQLWAEAAAREAEGASIRLPEPLWIAAKAEQDKRQVDDPFLVRLSEKLDGFEGTIKTEDVWRLLEVPIERRNQNGAGARMAAVMRKLGWEKPNKRGQLRFRGQQLACYIKGNKYGAHDNELTITKHGDSYVVVEDAAEDGDDL